MKNIQFSTFLLAILFCISVQLNAQNVAINNDGSTANASSILDVKSIDKGMLVPRMTSVQRTSIASPANGLLVFDTDSASFSYYNGTSWLFLNATNNIGKAWSTKGNNGILATDFIGTTDAQELFFKINNNNAGYLKNTSNNTAFGNRAGNTVTGTNNTLIGSFVGSLPMSGNFNTGIGVQTFNATTTGSSNTGVGFYNLRSGITGSYNTALGTLNIDYTTGSYNIGIGNATLSHGFQSGQNFAKNIAIGYIAQRSQIYGIGNIAIGENALGSDTIGVSNIAIGNQALANSTYRSNLIAIGDSALTSNNAGNDNIALGSKSLKLNDNGYTNIAIGINSLEKNVGGYRNTSIGANALAASVSGHSNIAIGPDALLRNTNNWNVSVGNATLANNTTGAGNVALGQSSLNTNNTGSYNTALGFNTDVSSTNFTNTTTVGAYAYATANNSLVLGSINTVNGAIADTKVGIGVTDPSEKLEIGKGRLRFRGNVTGGNAHGITWTNNAGTTDRAFIGMETDDYFGIFNFGYGWNVRTHNTSGEVGINKQPGFTNSESRLQVKQSIGASVAQRGIGIETAVNTNRWDMWVDNNAAPDYNFNYNGALRGYFQNATGNYIVVSDKNLKKDIEPLNNTTKKLLLLQPYQYHYNQNTSSDPLSIGFMAQDVLKIFPDAVAKKQLDNGKEQLGVNYQYFTVLSVKAIQEQQVQIDELKKENIQLKNKIDEILLLLKKQ